MQQVIGIQLLSNFIFLSPSYEGLTRLYSLVFFCLYYSLLIGFSISLYGLLLVLLRSDFVDSVGASLVSLSRRKYFMHRITWIRPHWIAAMLLATTPIMTLAENLEHAIESQVKTDLAAKKSQQQIDNLADETTQMLTEYRDVLRQTGSLRAYNDQLNKLVTSQQAELESISLQLRNIETTQRDIVPLMLKMIDTMVLFVELDIPFLPEERQQRVQQLQTLMERADVTLAEKYRRILEAYQVETEYGRTIEAYQGELNVGDNSRTVDFLRIGRVSLYYLTLDGLEAGIWNQKEWQQLDDSYRQSISQGLKVAKKQLPPDLLVLPVTTAEAMQ